MTENILSNTCTVSRATTSNEGGMLSKVWTEVGVYTCRITAPGSSGEQSRSGASGWVADKRKLYVEKEADIQKEDRVTVNGESYKVLNRHENKGANGTVLITCNVIEYK